VLVDVISSIAEARSDLFLNRTAIVVDVLRATSTIITALENGSSGVLAVETVCQAKTSRQPGDLLGGERFCKKIAGFELGNSPLEYTEEVVGGKRVVLTTTNGTRAIQKSAKAAHLLAGALLNSASCAEAALRFRRDLIILCSGTQDEFALEDGLCAGLLVEELANRCTEPIVVNDFAAAMLHAYRSARPALQEIIMQSSNGRKLAKIGFEEDVRYCCEVNRTSVVPVLQGDLLVRYEPS
jgi:2-phosphosulfolactate phosphatase